jgi:hypothetical protein
MSFNPYYQPSPFQPSAFQQQIQERPPQFVERLNVNCLQVLAGTGKCCTPLYRPVIWSPCINSCAVPPPITSTSVVLTLCPPKNSCCPTACGSKCCGGEPSESYQWRSIDPTSITSPDGKYKLQATNSGISVSFEGTLLYTLPTLAPTAGQVLTAGGLSDPKQLIWSAVSP